MPELLLIGVGVMGRPYLDAARGLGVSVHAIESHDRAAAIRDDVAHLTTVRGDGDECWAAAAVAAAATRPPDAVVAFAEQHVLAAALVADELSLPGPSLRAATLSRNKALQRGRCAAAGVRQPDFLIADDLAAAADWAGARFPVVVKALSSTGSLGVELVADAAGWSEVVERRRAESPLLIEAAVEGPEYSWEALVRNGRPWLANVTAKDTTGPPRFIEIGHRTGVRLAPADAAAVEALGTAVIGALGLRTGIVHLEFRLADAGPTLMEVAVRTPGDFLMEMLGYSYRLDWFEMVVRLALGLPLPEPPAGEPTPAAGYFPLADPGVVTAIEGLDEVRGHPSVQRAGVLVGVGDTVPPAVSSMQRRAFVLFSANTVADLDAARDLARAKLAIRTRPV